MEPVSTEPFPPDDELAKRLFSSPGQGESRHRQDCSFGPDHSPTKRVPLHKDDTWEYKNQKRAVGVTRRKPRVGFCGALIFLALCLVALALAVQFNSWGWYTITAERKSHTVSTWESGSPLGGVGSNFRFLYSAFQIGQFTTLLVLMG